MVATPKKVLSAMTKRLKRRPTWRENNNTSPTAGPVKERTVSSGSRIRQTSRRLSDNLVHDMHVQMKAAALFIDKDTEEIPLNITCTKIILTEMASDAVEISIQIKGEVTKMPIGDNVTVRIPSRSSEITIMIFQKDTAASKSTLRETTAEKPATPAQVFKKKFATLRTSRKDAQESGLLGSAQVLADDLLQPKSGVTEITVMKDGRGKRSVLPLGCVFIKTTTKADNDSTSANADIDKALAEMNKENERLVIEQDMRNASLGPDSGGNLTIVREGFVSVERDADRTGWKLYWATLLSTGQLLCYEDQFSKKGPGAEEMVFDLGGASHVTRPPMHEMPSRNGIKVTFLDGGVPFYILAETMPECRAWIKALESTITTNLVARTA